MPIGAWIFRERLMMPLSDIEDHFTRADVLTLRQLLRVPRQVCNDIFWTGARGRVCGSPGAQVVGSAVPYSFGSPP